ncbi:MAG TPA: serine/threonine-protein kinase, partial [Labilithrix sp.]|nr:serine/threonine-protein kinase [Labilithrix sp.]
MGSTSQPLPLAIGEGQTIAGKYFIVRQLGEGGMCTVFEAEHVGLRQGLALKILKAELADDADCVARFEREARAAAQLRSLNVAKVFDVDYLPGGRPYITMELLVGHDLGQELHDSGRLPIELAVDYVRQACMGIAEAHALGIVHRDLKPENLFLTELGELTDRKLLKILDFGIAKNVSDNARRLTAPDAVFGTVDYMSPEQIRSASKVDHRTDLWSLGVILFELLTGRTPYEGDARSVIAQIVSDPIRSPATLVPELPPSLVATVMKALHKDPDQRFQSAEDLRAALHGYGEFEPITSVIARLPPQSVPRRVVRTSPSLQGGSTSAAAEAARDARTHGSWETKNEPRSWGRTWILMPAIAMVAGGLAGFLYWRGHGLPWLARATSGAEATAVATAVPVPAASTLPPALPVATPEVAPSAPATPPPPEVPAPIESATPSAIASAKSAKKVTRTASPPRATTPAPAAPPPP